MERSSISLDLRRQPRKQLIIKSFYFEGKMPEIAIF